MHERERRSSVELLPVTRELLAQVERETGRPVVIRPEPAIKTRGRAMYAVSDPDRSRHLVLFDPDEQRHLDHLVAHEIGHIIQFATAAPDNRLLPLTTHAHFKTAAEELADDLARLSRQGFSARSLAEAVRLWATGIVAQLSDIPADIAIEGWIRGNPPLRSAQRNSLADQAVLLARSMRPAVRAFTPPRIWIASNAMNYALTKPVAGFLNEPWMLRPYRNTEPSRLGDELLELRRELDPQDLEGHRRVSNTWAERLGFSRWFAWSSLDQLPSDIRGGWE